MAPTSDSPDDADARADATAWCAAVARQYDDAELEALNTWLDTRIDTNQAVLESLNTRFALLFSVLAGALTLLATLAESSVLPLTVITLLVLAWASGVGLVGLRPSKFKDRDPSSTVETLWGPRLPREVLARLYLRRRIFYSQQATLIINRAANLRLSSWLTTAGVLLSVTVVALSRAS